MTQFIHIPKTGGTTVHQLCQNGDCAWKHAGHSITLGVEPAAFTIRDPQSRIISAIQHLKFHSQRRNDDVMEFRTILKNAVNLTQVLPALDLIDDESFGYYRANMFMLPMTNWLGTLEEYKEREHVVVAAIETSAINDYFDSITHERNHQSYNLTFDTTPTAEFIAWFDSKYSADVELYNYICQQPYYVSGEQ